MERPESEAQRAAEARRAIETVWRIEAPKLIASLTRMLRDVALAEDVAQDALVKALEAWPGSGIPDKPGAWLMAAAKNRAIDQFRRSGILRQKEAEIGRQLDALDPAGDPSRVVEEEVGDDLLGLIFIACHPILGSEARVALTLRLIGGLTTEEIARAFLVPVPTIAQRIVRAKRTLGEAGVPFEVPEGPDRDARLSSVLEVVYLIFNEGYAATSGGDWARPELCEEAMRLGRVLAELAPKEPEVHGLLALMELQASRLRARVGEAGEPVLLLDQDRGRWDRLLVTHGLAALEKAERLGGSRGPYALQAAIAACHARAATPEDTDWGRLRSLYDALAQVAPSPVVELNRAVAVSMESGPGEGLKVLDRLIDDPALAGYHLLPSVRGALLARLGRQEEARLEFERAAALAGNSRERDLLLRRSKARA